MTKNKFSKIGMLALTLIFALVLAGCGSADGGPTGNPTGNPTDTYTTKAPGLYIGDSTEAVDLSGQTESSALEKALAYIAADTDPGHTVYTISLSDTQTNLAPGTILDTAGVTVTIRSDIAAERRIKLSAQGMLFFVGGSFDASPKDAKLILDGYITLEGLATSAYGGADGSNNNTDLVRVSYGGKLEMHGHAKITGNADANTTVIYGGGVRLTGGTTNKAYLTMDGYSAISGNTAVNTNGGNNAVGGGVYAVKGVIALSGSAEISGNTVKGNAAQGGGIHATNSDITLSENAKISGNTIWSLNNNASGGGVYLYSTGSFTMSGGTISGNTARSDTANASGGGLYIAQNDGEILFTMSGGEVKDNVLVYKTYGSGGGYRVLSKTDLSGTARITPKAGGSITANSPEAGLSTDTRNSTSITSASLPLRMGTLSGSHIVALIDVPSGSSSGRYVIAPLTDNYSGNAPVGRFALGKFIKATDDYATTDIADTRKIDNNGQLVDK